MPKATVVVIIHKAIDKRVGDQNTALDFDQPVPGSSQRMTKPEMGLATRGGIGGHETRLPAHHVVHRVRDFEGNLLDHILVPYDGTEEDARRAAKHAHRLRDANYPEASQIQSMTGATGAHGEPKFVISPNLEHVSPAGSQEARYIFGDMSAKPGAHRFAHR